MRAKFNRFFCAGIFAVLLLVSAASAQRAEITVSLNEQFFDTLLDSVFQNFDAPEFPLADGNDTCREKIKVLREISGVRTAVRFRDGRISVPLAFSGDHRLPIIGCVDFAGWADTRIDLEFDKEGQRLIGRAHVQKVNLSGAGGAGGTLIARLLQGSIDKKLNPIEIIRLDRLSFVVPIANNGNLRLKAVAAQPEIVNGTLNVRIGYEFVKE